MKNLSVFVKFVKKNFFSKDYGLPSQCATTKKTLPAMPERVRRLWSKGSRTCRSIEIKGEPIRSAEYFLKVRIGHAGKENEGRSAVTRG
ncbi:MAG: hypothetical protein WBM27_08340 [bacterium]